MYLGHYKPPPLERDQLRVRVKAAAINPLDWRQRNGATKLLMGWRSGKGMGNDFAGVVEAVGDGVENLRVGDEVFGTMNFLRPGAFAEVLVTESSQVAKKPSRLSFAEAACLPIPATVAWAALLHRASLSSGARVFINGCTGAVGSMAVQLAIHHGASVTGTTDQASLESARAAGVGTALDYRDPELWKGLAPFDVLFDTVGALDVSFGLSRLAPEGAFVDINPSFRRVLRGVWSPRYKVAFATMATSRLAEIGDLAERGVLRPTIGMEANLSDGIATIAAVESGRRPPGRVVITTSA
jgi:NADPH:quinone reductase-like Zn-dependent oxidoreductase